MHKRSHPVRRPLKDMQLYIGIFMVLIPAAAALLVPAFPGIDPYAQDLYGTLLPPGASLSHPLGTDQLGRDYLARLIYAARTDLLVMAGAEAVPFVLGTFLGMFTGYAGGRADSIVSLITDTLVAFPYYLLVIVVAFMAGAGAKGIFITFIIVGWIVYARPSKEVARSLKESGWVQSAKLMGYSEPRILISELLPNVLPQAVVVLMSDMTSMLTMIVTLGYLGTGITPPVPDWGNMIAEGQSLISTAPWLSLLPGLMVVYMGVALSLVGDGLSGRWRR